MSLLEKIACNQDLVVEGQVEDLQEGSLDSHLWLSVLLYKQANLLDLSIRVLHEVDCLELGCGSFTVLGFQSLLDFLVDGIVLVVQVSQLDE